jgi:hypothetical protein
MLLRNEIVELGLKNGSIGTIKAVVYKDAEGPRGPEGFKMHPAYVVVDFPDCKIPEEDQIMPGWPRTYVPIVPCHNICEHKYCAVIQIPLRPCKAITIHKSQGQSVGPNEVWKKILVEFLAAQARNKTPVLKQVAFSRATSIDCLAVLDESEITYDMIMKIGKGKSYKKRQEFEYRLQYLATTTQAPIMDKVAVYDTSTNKTFDGGYEALLQWYHHWIPSHSS